MNMVPILLLTILCEVKRSYMKPRTNEILKYSNDSKDEVRNQYDKNHYQVDCSDLNPVPPLSRSVASLLSSLYFSFSIRQIEIIMSTIRAPVMTKSIKSSNILQIVYAQ